MDKINVIVVLGAIGVIIAAHLPAWWQRMREEQRRRRR
jgi:hypothetical protein